ncbi:hypothetical protein BH11PLA2_BH11PLA2_37140 [soil metagenome]
MRCILVNHACDRNQFKRGSGQIRLELLGHADAPTEDPDLLLSLDDLIPRLESKDVTGPLGAVVGRLAELIGDFKQRLRGKAIDLKPRVWSFVAVAVGTGNVRDCIF